jgi:hypothetical protein
MAKSEAKRQQQLAKKKAKERGKQRQLVQRKQQLCSLSGKMTEAGNGKIEHCYYGCSNVEHGLHQVLILRRCRSGKLAFAIFLVDSLCLGVKDCFGRSCNREEFDTMLDRLSDLNEMRSITAETARAIVESSIEYAEKIGIHPHSLYRQVSPIWGDIERGTLPVDFEFGQDGKPCYVQGPFESPATARRIINLLDEAVGNGNYQYIRSFSGEASSIDALENSWGRGVNLSDDEEANVIDEEIDNSDTIDGHVVNRNLEQTAPAT